MTCDTTTRAAPARPWTRGAGLAAVVVTIAAGIPVSAGPLAAGEPMRFDFTWVGTRACSAGAKSPAMTLAGVPKGTARLVFALRTESGSEHFGNGFVEYQGQDQVPIGDLDVRMPCRSAVYTWILTATDRNGAVLAGAVRTGPFP